MRNTILLLSACMLFSCTDKLDLKPKSSIVLVKTAKDLELILDNTDVMNTTPALPQLSADEYFIPDVEEWQAQYWATSRNAAVWEKDIYEGLTNIPDWKLPFEAIFYCNSVLDILAQQQIDNDAERKILKGWALFGRAYATYTLTSIFAKSYNSATASEDLGVPLKLSSDIEKIVQRSTVQETFNQIIKDAMDASELLQQDVIKGKRTRPSKAAANAFLARVYLSMRNYEQAELYADKTLALYAKLIDYNTLSTTAQSAFTFDSEETIYFSQQSLDYGELAGTRTSYGIVPELIALYHPSDLRLPIYFRKNTLGNYCVKGINSLSAAPFTGLGTDEIYLIKAECLARRGQTLPSMTLLNKLLQTRWNPNATIPAKSYEDLTAPNAETALELVLLERRKALIWRNLRWSDLKRLNLEGRNITITRKIGTKTYSLEPNSAKYVLPIPDDEIGLSGIQQNTR